MHCHVDSRTLSGCLAGRSILAEGHTGERGRGQALGVRPLAELDGFSTFLPATQITHCEVTLPATPFPPSNGCCYLAFPQWTLTFVAASTRRQFEPNQLTFTFICCF
ncbi:hypothetical protein TNCV_1667271 [Trichonephila clavipes]|nr:hypothetical protein TNCV_1667271 [Trichonephila clavipes]